MVLFLGFVLITFSIKHCCIVKANLFFNGMNSALRAFVLTRSSVWFVVCFNGSVGLN